MCACVCACACVCVGVGVGGPIAVASMRVPDESSRLGEIVEAVKAFESAVKKTPRKTLSVSLPLPTCGAKVLPHNKIHDIVPLFLV